MRLFLLHAGMRLTARVWTDDVRVPRRAGPPGGRAAAARTDTGMIWTFLIYFNL